MAFSVVRLSVVRLVGGYRLRGTSGGLPPWYPRGDPPLGFSSSHLLDTSCSRSPSLLIVIPHDRRLSSSSSRILMLVFSPCRESVNPGVSLLSSSRFLVVASPSYM